MAKTEAELEKAREELKQAKELKKEARTKVWRSFGVVPREIGRLGKRAGEKVIEDIGKAGTRIKELPDRISEGGERVAAVRQQARGVKQEARANKKLAKALVREEARDILDGGGSYEAAEGARTLKGWAKDQNEFAKIRRGQARYMEREMGRREFRWVRAETREKIGNGVQHIRTAWTQGRAAIQRANEMRQDAAVLRRNARETEREAREALLKQAKDLKKEARDLRDEAGGPLRRVGKAVRDQAAKLRPGRNQPEASYESWDFLNKPPASSREPSVSGSTAHEKEMMARNAAVEKKLEPTSRFSVTTASTASLKSLEGGDMHSRLAALESGLSSRDSVTSFETSTAASSVFSGSRAANAGSSRTSSSLDTPARQKDPETVARDAMRDRALERLAGRGGR